MASKGRGRYVNSLDGLRALCALAVVGYHMRLSWCGGGLLGVTVLFVLSGYLVTTGLIREFGSTRGTIDLKGFWARRFWRLMPTVFVFVAVTGALCAFLNHALFTKMRPDILPALFMVINWTKIFSQESYFAAAGAPSPLTHFWSLAIEAQFYLIWPPIFYFLMRKGVKRRPVRIGLIVLTIASAALMAALYVPGADPTRPYYGTDTRAMSLLLGSWLAVAWPFDRMAARKVNRLKGFGKVIVNVLGPLCIVGLVAMMLLTEGYSSFSYYGGILLCSVLTVGAVAALVPEGSVLSRVFSAKPLVWVGSRSYAIYLWHYPILELMNPLSATGGVPWWKLLLELALILVVSELSYRFVEQPLRKGIVLKAPAKGKGVKKRSAKQSPLANLLPYVPALLVGGVAAIITVVGLVVVQPVTVAGDAVGEKRVMHATLRKPVQDGVYDVVFIGDSVSLGANEQLNAAFPHGVIDTRGERQAEEALDALESYLDLGVVGDQVVISIGTNGVLDTDVMDAFVKAVGDERELWFVNLRSPNAKDVDNNAMIETYVNKYDNVHLIDWYGASAGNDDWLIEDGIHLTWDGRDAFSKLVVDTMDYVAPDKGNTAYDVTILGDRVCLDATDALADAFPGGLVDAADGRKPEEVTTAYQGYAEQGVVGNAVVVCIGNEDPLEAADLKSIVDAVGKEKMLWFVNVRVPGDWGTNNNRLLARVAEQYDNVGVIDWYKESDGQDKWFEEDGLSLTDAGAEAYAKLVASVVVVEDEKDEDEAKQGTKAEGEDYGSYSDYDYGYGYEDDSTSATSSSSDSSYDSDSSSSYGYDTSSSSSESENGYGSGADSDSDYGYDSYGQYDQYGGYDSSYSSEDYDS